MDSSYYEMYMQTAQPSAFQVIVSLVLTAIALVSMWKLFEKAGEPGWAAIVPLYSLYVLFKITWGNGWKCLLMLIPLANIVIGIITTIKLAKAFGKSSGYGVGMVFLGFIFMPMLAFSDAQYLGVPN